ncbi:hypothetical protein [Streptomyces caniscabiei]|uniref:hypothetical protein n=1 Tax=Streptomyces caniscabiei TaxID=2746961 RepID=UPI0038F7A560
MTADEGQKGDGTGVPHEGVGFCREGQREVRALLQGGGGVTPSLVASVHERVDERRFDGRGDDADLDSGPSDG